MQKPKRRKDGRYYFAGTQFRKPVGLAQVSLTLDNSDNSLETEYSEVTVTEEFLDLVKQNI